MKRQKATYHFRYESHTTRPAQSRNGPDPSLETDLGDQVRANIEGRAVLARCETVTAYRKIYDKNTGYPNLIRSLHRRGHQIASNTWTHLDMEKIGKQAYIRKMLDNGIALAQVMGTIPTYMRPSFGSCSDECLKFDKDLEAGGMVALTHDTKFYTTDNLVPHMVAQLKRRGLKGVTFGECLGDPKESWYREVKN
ncbi:hypothetical protein AB5N19_14054 [Seiridium cardinale]